MKTITLKRILHPIGALFYNMRVLSKRTSWEARASKLHIQLMESAAIHGDFDNRVMGYISAMKTLKPSRELYEVNNISDFYEFEQFKLFIVDDLQQFARWWNKGTKHLPKNSPYLPQYIPFFTK